VIGYLICTHHSFYATALFFYAGITDLLDGWIARRWNLQTVVGSVVDPMADKTLMTILVGSLAYTGSIPLPLATLILGRDVSLAVAAIYYRYASLPAPKTLARYWDFSLPSAEVHPTQLSKYNTFLQLLLIGYTLALPFVPQPAELGLGGLLGENWDGFTSIFQATVACTTVWSGFEYAFKKSAVVILGDDEKLKRKQGFRGRAVVGGSFAAFVGLAAWLWVSKSLGDDDAHRNLQREEPPEKKR
jgi:cardiolipin synthase (CMP-forming)